MSLKVVFAAFLFLLVATEEVNGCDNKSLLCFGYNALGYCKATSSHHQWMKINCQKSCSFCPGPTPAPTLPPMDHSKCGRRGDGHTRIVGGVNARPGDWPWQVQIDWKGDYNKLWCGGTLLNEEWVLSAAHCFEDDTNPRNYRIALGEHNVHVNGNQQHHSIDKIIMHPNYDGVNLDNDMALIRLKNKTPFSKYISPACFPNATVDFADGEECYVTGWGALQSNGGFPSILKQAKLPTVSNQECHRAMGRNTITNNMLCAGYLNKKIDSCQGDSGGPLVCRKRNAATGDDTWFLWGVVSWGYGCAGSGTYGVYASTKVMGSWVANIVYT